MHDVIIMPTNRLFLNIVRLFHEKDSHGPNYHGHQVCCWKSQGIAIGGSSQSVLHLLLHIHIRIGSHAFHEGFKHCRATRALLLKVHLIAVDSLPKRQPCLRRQQIGYTCNCNLPLHVALRILSQSVCSRAPEPQD